MTALKHPTFGDIDAAFTVESKFFGKECSLDDINRQDVVLTKRVGVWEQVHATAERWIATRGMMRKVSPERPPSSPLTNLQAALQALKES
jgi:hypothetical protein